VEVCTSFLSSTFGRSHTPLFATSSNGPQDIKLTGIGSATPSKIITNSDLENFLDTDNEWIKTRTGIEQRHVLGYGEGDDTQLRQLFVRASENALQMSKTEAEEVDLVICCTSSQEDLFGDASFVANELGCSNAFCFDLTAACTGFLFGMVTASQFLSGRGSGVGKALVVGGDALTRFVDWDDRNSAILFGDGAGAMVMESQEGGGGVMGYSAHSNGKGACDLMMGYKGEKRTIDIPGQPFDISTVSYNPMTMNGRAVYKFATREVPVVLQEAMDAANISAQDVDWLLLHQANIRIMETISARLGIPMDKVITNLSDYGNTSAGSIPLALDEAVRAGKVKKGDIVACAGFGAGLSWASAIIRWG